MNYSNLFNFNSAAMLEFDLLDGHPIGDFNCFTGDTQDWPQVKCPWLFDCPTEPLVDLPDDLLDFGTDDLVLPPPKRPRLTMEDALQEFNSNYAAPPKPDPLKAVVFTDEINRWIDSCLNLDFLEPCVDALPDKSDPQPSTPSSSQLVDKSDPQPPVLMLENDDRGGKKKERVHWTQEEHSLFLMGMKMYGVGKWKAISENVLKTRSHLQIASHAQKHFRRCNSNGGKKMRRSIHDVTIDHIPDPMGSSY